jgi:PAS domain S-box-containing protein
MANGLAPLLVVDDDPINRDMLSRRLVRSGFTVDTAASGREALDYVASRPTELVLLDVQMPEMSGMEVLQEIRRTRPSSVLPVLMVTAKDQSEDIVSALACGADDYITKPVDFPVALARIRTQLSRKRAEDRLRESEERYALAARGANDGLWDWNLVSGEIYVSPRWKTIVGLDEQEVVLPRQWFDLVHPDDLGRLRESLDAHLAGRTPHFESEYRIRHTSGAFRWVLARALAFRSADGVAVRVAGSQADFTDGKVFDPLTGLPNRLLLNDRLERALQHHRSHDVQRCAVLFVDLDQFKVVNDSLGAHLGDELIRAVAARLESSLRRTDTIVRSPSDPPETQAAPETTLARVSGDEFIVLLHDVRHAVDASRVADRIQHNMAHVFDVSGCQVFVTASIGIALSHRGDSCPEAIVNDADTAMHRAKSAGHGRIELFDDTMRHEVQQRLQLDTSLRLGIARDEFLPYFQPIVDLRSGRLSGFEALLRWRHPTRGIVSPSEFVPVIEENGLVEPIGRRFFEQVCRQLREWEDAYPSAERLSVNVNFASQQFLEVGLVERLLDNLASNRLTPARIVIEITESAAIQNPDISERLLGELRGVGFRVVLDDFGTGYSSLVCLHQLPISGFKLDRTLLVASEQNPALLRTVVALSDSLGLSVTAEGIETQAQFDRLAALGCDFGQGYLFARPVPADQAAQIIAQEPIWLPAEKALA